MTIFTDFDGTITIRDTGSELFHEVDELQSLQQSYVRHNISAQDFWERVTHLSRPFSDDELSKFFQQFEIDPTFSAFADFCRERSLPLYVVSDGLDFYIHAIFAAKGIVDLPVFANAASLTDGRIGVSFPFLHEHCEGFSANCKCSHVLGHSPDDQSIVYIGNGTSDCCPAEKSDIIFAKDRLARYCEEKNIPYHNFHSFTDVQQQLQKYLDRPRQYKRSAAEQKRRELWKGE